MLAQLALIDRLEVPRQTVRLNRVHEWRAFLDLFGGVGLDEAEIFEVFRVGRLEVEVGGDVPAQLQLVRVGVTVEQTLQSLQLLRLSLREIVLVGRPAIEG